MQLRKTEFIGSVHDNGISARNVNAGFNNRCAKQKVISLLIKVTHDAFKLSFIHLAVAHHNTGFGDELSELLAPVFNR